MLFVFIHWNIVESIGTVHLWEVVLILNLVFLSLYIVDQLIKRFFKKRIEVFERQNEIRKVCDSLVENLINFSKKVTMKNLVLRHEIFLFVVYVKPRL